MPRALRVLMSYIPTPLPVGMTEFIKWSDNIIDLAGQFADVDSMRYALANFVVHEKPTAARIPVQKFIRMLRKAAANQVASAIFQDIKQKQMDRVTASVAASTQEGRDAVKQQQAADTGVQSQGQSDAKKETADV